MHSNSKHGKLLHTNLSSENTADQQYVVDTIIANYEPTDMVKRSLFKSSLSTMNDFPSIKEPFTIRQKNKKIRKCKTEKNSESPSDEKK